MTATTKATIPATDHLHDVDLSALATKAELMALATTVDHAVDSILDLQMRVAKLEGGIPKPPDPPPSTGTTPPASIDRTGATDVSAALNSWLMGLPVNADADLAAGTYRIASGQLKLSGRKALTIRNGSLNFTKVLSGSSAGMILLDQQAGFIVLDGLVIRGAATGKPGQSESNHVIQAQGCQGLVVRNVTASFAGGDGIYSGGYVNPTWTHDLIVTGCTFTDCGRMGVGVADGLTNALIEGNTFDRFGWYPTLDIEPNGIAVGSPAGPAHFENITFRGNSIGRGNSAKYTFVVSTASNEHKAEPVVSGIVVTGNRTLYSDTPWNPIVSGWSSAVTMSGNQ